MYIPNEIICGQKIYNDKVEDLAFLTYTKVDGTICSEKSFNNWLKVDRLWPGYSNQKTNFDNVPTTGFTVIKTVGGDSGNIRKAYVRIKDPRGFEFEITDENFLTICKTTGVTKGVLDGAFVFAFLDRGRIYLLSTESPYYESSLAETQKYIEDYNKAKDVPKFSFKNIKKGYSYTVNYNGNRGIIAIYIGKTPVANWKDEYKNEHLFLLLNYNYREYTINKIEILRNNNIVFENGPSNMSVEQCDTLIENIGKCSCSSITYDIMYHKQLRSKENTDYIVNILNTKF